MADSYWLEEHSHHDRTSCSDNSPINADPTGSHGCARCTAIALYQHGVYLTALREIAATDAGEAGKLARSALAKGDINE